MPAVFPKVHSEVEVSQRNDRLNRANRLPYRSSGGLICSQHFPNVFAKRTPLVRVQNTLRKCQLIARMGSLKKAELQGQPKFFLSAFLNFLLLRETHSPGEGHQARADRPVTDYLALRTHPPSSSFKPTPIPRGPAARGRELTNLSLWCK